MAKIHRLRPPEDIPDSAMADVAFLLLIFFLATTTIAEEFGLTLVLPAPSEQSQAKEVNRDNVMIVSTDETGRVFLVDGDAIPSLNALQGIYRERYASNEKLIVSIEPHPKAPYRSMVDILDEMKAVEARRISIKSKLR